MGSQESWSIHETWTEAKAAACRPSDWGRVWFADHGFELDPSTGSVSVQRTDPIQLLETWSGDLPLLEEEDELDGLEFEPYEEEGLA
jgi:hypothetical protein